MLSPAAPRRDRERMRTTVVAPDRDDHGCKARSQGLALAQRVCAVYCHTCTRCGRIQDSEIPEPCCGPVRAMLAVCQPERRRLLQHTAPPPGGKTPAWINVVPPARPPGQLQVPGIDDLARLAIRRLWERLEAGEAAGRPASAPAGHTPIRSASASRPSPSCSAGLTAAGHPGGPGIPSRIGGNGPPGCPAPGHDEAGRSRSRPASPWSSLRSAGDVAQVLGSVSYRWVMEP